jgi:hypothetical protein
MASEENERREFFRIKDRLLLQFREVTLDESLALEKSLKGADVFPDPSALGSDALPDEAQLRKNKLYAYLESVDRKLDALIALLSRRDNPFSGTYFDITISGSGLQFHSPVKLDESARLELRIGLSPSVDRRITALGRVVRTSPSGPEDGAGWETAVAFTAISEKDRDALIAYVFSRERERLRTKQVP